ncbi:MAG: diguanylate cyclase [Gammaproteobacteria bacterium]|nr:diguanylate cyclase [Gammaproteobacteria bacterium]
MFIKKSNTKQSNKGIAIGFGLIILLMLIQMTLALWQFNEVKVEFEKVVDVYNVRMQLVQKMRVISRERAPILFSMVSTDDAFEIDDLKQEFGSLGSQFLILRDQLIATGLSEQEVKILDHHRAFARSIVPGQRKVIELVEQENFSEAQSLLVKEVSPNQTIALSKLDELIIFENRSSKKAMKKAKTLFANTQKELVIATFFGIILSIVIGGFVSTRFSHFINTLKKNKDELEVTVAERTKDLLKVNEQLEHLAHYDALTGLPNRTSFLGHLAQGMDNMSDKNKGLALLFIDLDGFKSINDDYGHDYGDEILRQVANRVEETLRNDDIFARLGGDEFTLIAKNIVDGDENTAVKIVADKIIEALSQPFDVIDAKCHIGSSIGIALYPTQTQDLDELISFADTAMYAVKRSGKNNYRIYESSMSKHS